jgi:DNA helicase INO80
MLDDIDFDDEDETNLHRHARRSAQEAVALARSQAEEFDARAALQRKTMDAIRLARGQAHIRDEPETTEEAGGPAPLLDRAFPLGYRSSCAR